MLDRERALEQARGLDDELKSGKDRGPLHGIPIGIKDIIDVAGLPTACGSKRWADGLPNRTPTVVANLREAGAVIMGKTVTTPYAWIDPPITRNPWNLERTPGGSSSGSAAAVACGMCFGAIGTQTGGSITRPASFCGVAGMKPTKWSRSMHGRGYQAIRPQPRPRRPDRPHRRRPANLVRRNAAIPIVEESRESSPRRDDSAAARPAARLLRSPGRSGRCDRRSTTRFDASQAAGAEIVELEIPSISSRSSRTTARVMAAEAAGVHSDWLDEFPDDYPPRIRELILEGRSLTALEYSIKDRMNSARPKLGTGVPAP